MSRVHTFPFAEPFALLLVASIEIHNQWVMETTQRERNNSIRQLDILAKPIANGLALSLSNQLVGKENIDCIVTVTGETWNLIGICDFFFIQY